MGIADIRRALEAGAAGKATFNDVRFGYVEGGRKQFLRFLYKLQQHPESIIQAYREFPGEEDPVKFASALGQELTANVKEKNQEN